MLIMRRMVLPHAAARSRRRSSDDTTRRSTFRRAELEAWQIAAGAIAVLFFALMLIRASGRRSFGQHSPFDACITFLPSARLKGAVGRRFCVLKHDGAAVLRWSSCTRQGHWAARGRRLEDLVNGGCSVQIKFKVRSRYLFGCRW